MVDIKRLWLVLFSLLLFGAAWVQPGFRLSAGDLTAESCSLRSLCRGLRAANAAAQEILAGQAETPKLSLDLTFSLGAPAGSAAQVSDTVLRATKGIAVMDRVYVNGVWTGCLHEGEALKVALRGWLRQNLPPGAEAGRFASELDIRSVYTRPDREMTLRDILLLVTGMAQVIYTDAAGNVVLG